MAKKTTKKKTTKAGARKKATTKKTAKKPAAKKSTPKKSTKKSTKKSAAKTTRKTTPKAASTKKKSTKAGASKKKTTKKSAPKKKTTKKTASKPKAQKARPEDNGSPDKAAEAVKPTPPPIRRVVRPTPPPPTEPQVEDWTPLSDAKLRKLKSGLTRKDLNQFKQLLLEKRAEIVGDVMGMEEARSGGNGGDLSNMPLHMADIGSDNYEQEFTLGLVESERKLLVEIDRALKRIQDKTYGVCIITGTPIPKARLEIKPWAKYSIEVVREREKRGLHSF